MGRYLSRKRDKISQKIHAKIVAKSYKIVYNRSTARRWGGSGTLYLKSAISELNAFPDDVYGRFARRKER